MGELCISSLMQKIREKIAQDLGVSVDDLPKVFSDIVKKWNAEFKCID